MRKPLKIVLAYEIAVRVFALDRSEGGRRREKTLDLMLRNHTPERTGIWRADRLALIQHVVQPWNRGP